MLKRPIYLVMSINIYMTRYNICKSEEINSFESYPVVALIQSFLTIGLMLQLRDAIRILSDYRLLRVLEHNAPKWFLAYYISHASHFCNTPYAFYLIVHACHIVCV